MKALRYRNWYVTDVMQESNNGSEWNDVSHEVAEGYAEVCDMVQGHLNEIWRPFLNEEVSYNLCQGVSEENESGIVIVHAHWSEGRILKSRAELPIAAQKPRHPLLILHVPVSND